MLWQAMKKVREVRGQLLDQMKTLRMSVISCGSDWDVVRKAICSGYFTNAGKIKGIGEYVNMRSGACARQPSLLRIVATRPDERRCLLCRDAGAFAPVVLTLWAWVHTGLRGVPRVDLHLEGVHGVSPLTLRCRQVCVLRLILLAVLWRRTVTAVDAEWLAELGPMFYSVKESYAQRIAKRRDVEKRKRSMEDEESDEKARLAKLAAGKRPDP